MAHGGSSARTEDNVELPDVAPERAAISDLDRSFSTRARRHVQRWRGVYVAFVLSRLLIMAVGFGTELLLRIRDVNPDTWRPFLHAETYPHYASIATQGYTLENAFGYPLLPGVMAAGASIGVPVSITAFVIANAAFLCGLIFMSVIGERYVGHAAATRAGIYLAIAPFSYWFSIASTESLLLVVLTASVLLALRATPAAWLGAGMLAAAAALTRPPGALIGIVLLAIALGQLHRRALRPAGITAALIAGALIPAAVFGFFWYLKSTTGDMLAALHAQDQFNRSVTLDGPIQALASASRLTAGGSVGQALELIATFGAAAMLVWFITQAAGRRSEVRGWFAFGVASLMLPLATGVLWQMPRFALLVPPVLWALGALGARRWLHIALLALFPLGLAIKVSTTVVGVAG